MLIDAERRSFSGNMQGAQWASEGVYKGTRLSERIAATQQIDRKTSRRSSDEEHKADALALRADEGRDKLR